MKRLVIILPNKKIWKILLKNNKKINKIKFLLKNYFKMKNIENIKKKEVVNFLKNNSVILVLNELSDELLELVGIKKSERKDLIKTNKTFIGVININDKKQELIDIEKIFEI